MGGKFNLNATDFALESEKQAVPERAEVQTVKEQKTASTVEPKRSAKPTSTSLLREKGAKEPWTRTSFKLPKSIHAYLATESMLRGTTATALLVEIIEGYKKSAKGYVNKELNEQMERVILKET